MSDNKKESIRGNSTQPETDTAGNVTTIPIVENPPSEVLTPEKEKETVNTSEKQTESKEPAISYDDFEPVNIGADIGGGNNTTPQSKADRRGEVFDPTIHCMNEDGSPKRNKDGTFKKRPLPKNKEIPIPPPPPPPPVDFNESAPPGTMQMVCMCLDVATVIMCNTIGPEMKPSPDERQILTDVYSRYVHYKGWDGQLSPEIAVIMVSFMFMSPRIPVIIKKWQDRKKGKQSAYVNIGSTGNGQDNVSQNHSPTSRS